MGPCRVTRVLHEKDAGCTSVKGMKHHLDQLGYEPGTETRGSEGGSRSTRKSVSGKDWSLRGSKFARDQQRRLRRPMCWQCGSILHLRRNSRRERTENCLRKYEQGLEYQQGAVGEEGLGALRAHDASIIVIMALRGASTVVYW